MPSTLSLPAGNYEGECFVRDEGAWIRPASAEAGSTENEGILIIKVFRFFLKKSIVLSPRFFARLGINSAQGWCQSLKACCGSWIDLVIINFVVFLHRRFSVRMLCYTRSFSP